MSKKKIILGVVFAVMSSLMVAGPASAAHCVSPSGESPGFSFFGKEFVQQKGAQGAPNAVASACNDTPERAKNDQTPDK